MRLRKKTAHLTSSELFLMDILWEAERPLSRPEILDNLEKATSEENRLPFATNTFHVLINSLLEKEYIIAIGDTGRGRGHARRYAPTVTRNEYFALQICSSDKFKPDDMPDIFAALMKYSKSIKLEPVLDEMDKLIQAKRAQEK